MSRTPEPRSRARVLSRSVTYYVTLCLSLQLACAAPAESAAPTLSPDESEELFRAGKQLFDQLAPAELKARFEFPTKAEWDAFTARFMRALEGDSLEDLA